LDQTWHPDHFFCTQCGCQFGEDGFQEKDGKPYCKEDYLAMFALKCKGCTMAITEGYISALSGQWHPQCFVCRVGLLRRIFNAARFFVLSNFFCLLFFSNDDFIRFVSLSSFFFFENKTNQTNTHTQNARAFCVNLIQNRIAAVLSVVHFTLSTRSPSAASAWASVQTTTRKTTASDGNVRAFTQLFLKLFFRQSSA
jgi:hypothetical protein